MIVVHHLNNSRSQRILWLLEELGVDYEIKKYKRTPMRRAPPELKSVHPLGKSPVITDGDVTIAESGAIVEYIISKYGNGKATPPESGTIDNLYFTHYTEGTLMPLRVNGYIYSFIPDQAPFYMRPFVRMVANQLNNQLVEPALKVNLEFVDDHLKKTGGLFSGPIGSNFTAAGYMMTFPLEALSTSGHLSDKPYILKFLSTVHSRPAYKRALEKGGEYAYAKAKL